MAVRRGSPGSRLDRSPQPGRGAPGSVVRRLVRSAVGLVLVLLAGLVVVLTVQHHDRQRLAQVERPGGPAMTAARRAAAALFSYDHSRFDADLAASLALTTSPYTDTYRDAADRVVRPAVEAQQSVVQADVRTAGATSATTADRLVALVVLDRTTRPGTGAPTVDRDDLRLTLVRRQGRWLVSGVESL